MNFSLVRGIASPALLSSLLLFSPSASLAKEVNVYSGRHYNTDKGVFKDFENKTGIKVNLLEAKGNALIERVKREGRSSKADVLILVDAARINNAANQGLFQPVKSKKLNKDVPSYLRDPSGRWFALTRRLRLIIANPSKVDTSKINTWEDLADPSLKGLVCLRNRKSPYNQSLVAAQYSQKGEAETKRLWTSILSNVSQPFFSKDSAQIRAVAQGQCGVAVVNHYYVARMVAGTKGEKDERLAKMVKVIIPEPAHINVSGGGVAKYSKNKKEAVKLLEFLVSSKGSKGIAKPTFELPLVGNSPIKEVKAFGSFKPESVTISQLGAHNTKAISLMAEIGWE